MSVLLHRQIKKHIAESKHILLLTDERIDGDTIGSTLGMFHVLRGAGKNVSVYSPSPLLGSLAFLPGTDAIMRTTDIFEDQSIDLVLIFDCSDGEYLKKHRKSLPVTAPIIVFDHHASNPHYGTLNLIEVDAASTADVVWRFVKSAGFAVNKDAAQCILTGIITDTNVFGNTGTTTQAIMAAHELTTLGAHLPEIVRATMMNKSLSTLRLWGLALERLHENREFGVMTTAIRRKDEEDLGVDEPDTKDLSNFLNMVIEGPDATLVLKETAEGDVKGSLRSMTRNVKEIAERYGGGGHDKAAGFKITRAHLEERGGEWVVVRD